jgi:amino-acid N-acetyltransferase
MLRMTVASRPTIRGAGTDDLPDVLQILNAAGLPTEDLSTAHDLCLWLATESDTPLGVIGLESFGAEGLLRSLAVVPERRQRGLGRELVARVERDAMSEGVKRIVLLTETAEPFFRHVGYEVIDRATVSGPVKQSAEFRSLCPASATCMSKSLLA